MTINTAFVFDFIIVKRDIITLVGSHQGMYIGGSNGIKRKKRLYGYDCR